jgi:hypothetical protein
MYTLGKKRRCFVHRVRTGPLLNTISGFTSMLFFQIKGDGSVEPNALGDQSLMDSHFWSIWIISKGRP